MTPPKLHEEKGGLVLPGVAWLVIVIFMGAFIRCIALFNIHIINPDGVLYIYQAKAIASGQWHLLNDCQLSYVTLYPFFIALVHTAVSDWVLSAQLVSLFFGTAMLIPIYLVVRRFCSLPTSLVTTLLYAFIPVFVRYSVDAMRDPTYWFFYAASIWAFLSHTHEDGRFSRSMALAILSSVLILLAALTRIEAVILYMAAILSIVADRGNRKIMRLTGFCLPLGLLICLGAIAVAVLGKDWTALIRLDDIAGKLTAPVTAYHDLRLQLKDLSTMYDGSLMGEFLANARHMIWLIVLGTVVSNAMEAFFHPYVPFFIIGFIAAIRQFDRRSPLLYPAILLILSFVLLCAHGLQKWIMTYRFIALLIIPSCALAGLGIDRTLRWMKARFNFDQAKAAAILVVFILLPGVTKSVKPIERDKAVYVQIGEQVAELAEGELPVGIAARNSTVRQWVTFYANAATSEPVCHRAFNVPTTSLEKLETKMRSKGIRYFLWEESRWKKRAFGQTSDDFTSDFEELGRWHHDDTGSLVLFRLPIEK